MRLKSINLEKTSYIQLDVRTHSSSRDWACSRSPWLEASKVRYVWGLGLGLGFFSEVNIIV